jgi:N-acetylglucosamine-6-phosphate deacetylase
VTLAPEMPGGMDALRQFVDASVVVAVGHCAADYDAAIAAFDAGASILTHAFNAMPGIHHRAPGPVAAAMDCHGVTLEVINDGVHVHPAVVRLAFEGAAGRIALITDAMAATGSADGQYQLGTLRVTVTDGVARLADGGSIAGSTLTLDTALRLAVTSVGLPVEVAVQALTETPARAIGRERDLGALAPGFAADAVLLDADFTVQGVWAAGSRLR